MADADRMWEVAQIMCSFPHLFPCVVLSAMGKVWAALIMRDLLISCLCSPVHGHLKDMSVSADYKLAASSRCRGIDYTSRECRSPCSSQVTPPFAVSSSCQTLHCVDLTVVLTGSFLQTMHVHALAVLPPLQ